MIADESGTGTPIVLLHGFALDHRGLLPLEATFERSGGWRRIFLDIPGANGAATATASGSQETADDVVRELRASLGDEPFAVIGNSFGGMIARHVAHELRSQVLGLATLAGVFVAEHEQRSVPPRTVVRSDPRVEPILGAALDDYRGFAVVESVESAEAFLRYELPALAAADQATLDRIGANYALDREPEDAHPEPFLQPTLHITGRQDDVVGYSDAWARIEHYPRASFVALDSAGHNILFEQPDLCAALITDWLHRMRQAG